MRIDDVSISDAPSAPSAPTANAASSTNSSGFTANWNAASGATGYQLDVATDSGFSAFVSGYNNRDVGNVTSTNVTGLSGGTTYYYRVRAYNGSGTSGNSNTNAVTTLSAGIPALLMTLPGQASPNTGTPTAQTAGTPFSVTVTATTDGATTDPSYTSSHNITFTLGSGSSVSPVSASVNFSGGVGVASITLTNTTATTITATDGTIAGTASSSLTVNPGAINSYIVTAASPQTAGTAFNVAVTAKDAYGNTVATDNSTVVTLSSASGNVQFDGNGDSTFGDNTKTLVNGTFTISAKDSTVETTTITATDANSKTGTSGNMVVNGIPQYRSTQSGNWNATSTWQVSLDNGSTWAAAAATPSSTDGAITILNNVTNTAAVTVDQVVVTNGGTLVMSTAFTVADGAGDDIDVQSGGVLLLNTSGVGPSFIAGATAGIESGGIVRVTAGSLTGAGTGINAASYVYKNGSILECGTTPSSSSVTFFPNVDNNTIPIFRLINNQTIGATAATTFNGVFEVNSGVTATWSGAGIKTFRNGIRGTGSFNQRAGQFVISGVTAQLGIGTLTLTNDAGLQIGSGSVVTLISDVTASLISGATTGIVTVAGTLDINGKTLTVSTAPVVTGTVLTEIDRAGSPGKIALSSGTLTNNGALTVTNIGSSLQAGDSFTLYTAPTFSGWFSSVTLPALAGSLLWDTNKLATNGVLAVYSFITNGVGSLSTRSNTPVIFLKSKMLAFTAGGHGVFVSAVSDPAHGSVVTNATQITYTPDADYVGSDAFYCTVSDANGSVTVQVNVTVIDPSNPTSAGNSGNLIIRDLGNGSVRLYITGTANTTYVLQTNGAVSTSGWGAYKSFTLPAIGVTNFDDTAGLGARFYRTVLP